MDSHEAFHLLTAGAAMGSRISCLFADVVSVGPRVCLSLCLPQPTPSLSCSPSPWLRVYKVLRAPCGAMELQLLLQEEVLGMGAIRYSTSTVSLSHIVRHFACIALFVPIVRQTERVRRFHLM